MIIFNEQTFWKKPLKNEHKKFIFNRMSNNYSVLLMFQHLFFLEEFLQLHGELKLGAISKTR